MTLEISFETAMVEKIYSALGQTVTYDDGVSPVSIYMIVDNSDEQFPSGFNVGVADANVIARVRLADITQPKRGDTITNANAVTYTVDSVTRLNETEWTIEIRP